VINVPDSSATALNRRFASDLAAPHKPLRKASRSGRNPRETIAASDVAKSLSSDKERPLLPLPRMSPNVVSTGAKAPTSKPYIESPLGV